MKADPVTKPDGEILYPPPGTPGHCRRFPPIPMIEITGAFFTNLSGSALETVPGWKTLAIPFSTFPIVTPAFYCGEWRDVRGWSARVKSWMKRSAKNNS
jgi:hypothetical protein